MLAFLDASFDAKSEHAPETSFQVLFRQRVRRMTLQPGIRHPRHAVMAFQPLCKGHGVGGMALAAYRERLHPDKELLSGKGVEAGSDVLEDLVTAMEGEGLGTEAVPQAVAALDKLREPVDVLVPREATAIDHDASEGSSVTSNPLGRRVDDDVHAVIEGSAEEAASTEGVVDLDSISGEYSATDARRLSHNHWDSGIMGHSR